MLRLLNDYQNKPFVQTKEKQDNKSITHERFVLHWSILYHLGGIHTVN